MREADSGGVCAWRPRGLSFLCLCLSSNNLNTTASGHPGGGWLEHAHKPACCCTKRGSHKRSRKRHKAFIVTPPPTNPVKGVNSFLCGYAGSGINMLWLRLHDVLLVDEICQEHMILTPPPPSSISGCFSPPPAWLQWCASRLIPALIDQAAESWRLFRQSVHQMKQPRRKMNTSC